MKSTFILSALALAAPSLALNNPISSSHALAVGLLTQSLYHVSSAYVVSPPTAAGQALSIKDMRKRKEIDITLSFGNDGGKKKKEGKKADSNDDSQQAAADVVDASNATLVDAGNSTDVVGASNGTVLDAGNSTIAVVDAGNATAVADAAAASVDVASVFAAAASQTAVATEGMASREVRRSTRGPYKRGLEERARLWG